MLRSAFRRVFCCGLGAQEDQTASNEPIYELIDEHQAQDAATTLRRLVASVDEIREILIPIAEVSDRMRRLVQNLHPLLVYRPEDGEYIDMTNGPHRPAPAAQAPEPLRSVWQIWLWERLDYGEPW